MQVAFNAYTYKCKTSLLQAYGHELPPCALLFAKKGMDGFNIRFVPYAKKFCQDNSIEYKLLLLLDNAPAHPSVEILQSKDGRVNTIFLPPNTTSII